MTSYYYKFTLTEQERELVKNYINLLVEEYLDNNPKSENPYDEFLNCLENTPFDEEFFITKSRLDLLEESISHKIEEVKLRIEEVYRIFNAVINDENYK